MARGSIGRSRSPSIAPFCSSTRKLSARDKGGQKGKDGHDLLLDVDVGGNTEELDDQLDAESQDEVKEDFEVALKYSPLHNLKPGVSYPATLVTTGDHDDRVVPAHSHKFIAALQAAQKGSAPVLTRIETKAGHGAGKPTAKIIEERADQWAFLVKALGVK